MYIPIFLGILLVAIYYLNGFFNGKQQVVKVKQNEDITKDVNKPYNKPVINDIKADNKAINTLSANTSPVAGDDKRNYAISPSDYLTWLLSSYRPRIAGFIQSSKKVVMYVEFLDDSNHAKERFNLEQLSSLGVRWVIKPYGLDMVSNGKEYIATAWPIDNFGKVPESKNETLRNSGKSDNEQNPASQQTNFQSEF